jgi:hypothetical protein
MVFAKAARAPGAAPNQYIGVSREFRNSLIILAKYASNRRAERVVRSALDPTACAVLVRSDKKKQSLTLFHRKNALVLYIFVIVVTAIFTALGVA